MSARAKDLMIEIGKLNAELEIERARCFHPMTARKYRLHRFHDMPWYDALCTECGAHWEDREGPPKGATVIDENAPI
jgi:hypothetical protein